MSPVETPLTVAGRIEFWRRLHERLAGLSDRLDRRTQSMILDAVHARVPMATPDEHLNMSRLMPSAERDGMYEAHGRAPATVTNTIAEEPIREMRARLMIKNEAHG